jgi:hypothetical protein
MRSLRSRPAVAVSLALVAGVARAAGDSGTSAMGEMSITGAQLGMMVAALAGLGGVFWFLAKVLSK